MWGTRLCVLLTVCLGITYCYLEIVPDRIETPFVNANHLVNVSLKVKRFGRGSPYYIVGGGVVKQTLNNNLTVHVDTYEYLHNEYRLSFMTIHNKLCDLINKDILMGSILRRLGLVCPIYPGVVVFQNATFKWENFPYVLPYTRALANITMRHGATNELLLWLKLYAHAKQH